MKANRKTPLHTKVIVDGKRAWFLAPDAEYPNEYGVVQIFLKDLWAFHDGHLGYNLYEAYEYKIIVIDNWAATDDEITKK